MTDLEVKVCDVAVWVIDRDHRRAETSLPDDAGACVVLRRVWCNTWCAGNWNVHHAERLEVVAIVAHWDLKVGGAWD